MTILRIHEAGVTLVRRKPYMCNTPWKSSDAVLDFCTMQCKDFFHFLQERAASIFRVREFGSDH
jgi:hypothetical protein